MATSTIIPALATPPGETSNFVDPDTLWKWNVLCQTVCLLSAGIAFLLRTYIRAWIKRVWILEDYLCCGSYIGLVIFSALLTTDIYKHGGTHEWNVAASDLPSILYYVNIIQIWYGIAAVCTKCAILTLYLRVFSPVRRSAFDITVRACILVTCGFYVGLTTAKICQCIPRERIWDKSVPGTCVDLPTLLGVSGFFNILSDVVILLVPLKGIWSLQMSRKRKIGVYAIFTFGTVAPGFSVIGFVMRFRLASSPDLTYNQPVILLWATAELAIGVMIICFPTLPGLLQRRRRRPSQSILNGSGLASRRKAYRLDNNTMDMEADDKTLFDGAYIETRQDRSHNPYLEIPMNAVINDIRGTEEADGVRYGGGYGGYGAALGAGHRRPGPAENVMPRVGILKVTEIEQSIT